MRSLRNTLIASAALAFALPADAQVVDTAQARFQPPTVIQYLRPQDKRGINMFETPKVEGAAYNGFVMQWGAAFTQQFQGLDHENNADSLPYAPAGPGTNNNRNRLIEIGNGFNNAGANMYLHAQLAPGIRVQLTSYLSSRHHNETWVKDGFLQIDASPIDLPIFNTLMEYTTLKIGHFEVNYGDFHFRRSDNGQAIYNPFVGNAIMDAFTTEIGTEAMVQRNGLFGILALTNGEIRGNIKDPQKRSPALMLKGGFDRQLSDDLRVRVSASYRQQKSAISNTLYSGDRAGARYFFVGENTNATEAAQFTSGNINPGFGDALTAIMINPFIKWNGVEFFGMYEMATGRGQEGTAGAAAGVAPPERDVTQMMGELLYRFGAGEKFYIGGRTNTFSGQIGQVVNANAVTTSFNYSNNASPVCSLAASTGTCFIGTEPSVVRNSLAAGWFITPSLMLKAEYVTQTYSDFLRSDIRSGLKFNGFMIEAVTAF